MIDINNNYNELVNKLEKFISKYYKNMLIKGLLLFVAMASTIFILISTLEYFGHFSTTIRTMLFFITLITLIWVIIKYVAIPLTKIYKLGTRLSYEEAANIIGKHFGPVSDKLLNILQLKNQFNSSQNQLAYAAINQKIDNLKPIPFLNAINLSKNKRYLKYLLPPIIIIVLTLIIYPAIFSDGAKRVVKFNTEFIPPAPFEFEIINKNLNVEHEQDFTVNAKIKGEEIPQEVYIKLNGYEYIMQKINAEEYSYTFKHVLNDVKFQFTADNFYSKSYILNVKHFPQITNFSISLNYPNYLQKNNDVVNNTGDLTLPEGTKITWKIKTSNTENFKIIKFFEGDSLLVNAKENKENIYELTTFANNSFNYQFISSNKVLQNKKSVNYQANVIKDQYPTINIESKKDSTSNKFILLNGNISDDYGITKLQAILTITSKSKSENNNAQNIKTIPIIFTKSLINQSFNQVLDLNTVDLNPGDEVSYFIEVFDNDAPHGFKKTKSETNTIIIPSTTEQNSLADKENKEIKKELEQTIIKAQKLQKELNNARKKLIDKKTLNFEEKKQLENLLNKQQDLQKEVENIKNKNAENIERQNEFSSPNEKILQKQEEINKLFNELMTDDYKKLYEEMQQMLKQLDKNKLQEKVEDLKTDNKELEKDLDRTLEVFKQLEFEQKLEKTKNKLNKLAEKQEELSKKSLEKLSEKEKENLKNEQEQLKKDFEELQKEMDKLEQLNKELPNPIDLNEVKKIEEEIKKELNNSNDELNKNQNSKASKSQKKASEKMEEMANKMEEAMQESAAEQAEEDAQALRQLLENLLQLSFDQEKLMTEFKQIETANPQYVIKTKEQKKLLDNAKMIEDSLFALSKRQPKVSNIVNKEIEDINNNIQKAINALVDRNTPQASVRQQFAMTAINNLSLLLSESLQQMQQQAQQQQKKKDKKSGNGSCNKPDGSGAPKPGAGKPKPNMASMRKMQEGLSKQMQQMKNGQQPGQQPGMSKELAKMAAEQEYLRQQMQKAANQLGQSEQNGQQTGKEGKQGKESGGKDGNAQLLREIAKQMEKNEEDIVNKRISQETLKRQQDILTRLLEAEKAERERDQDDKRKSTEAKILTKVSPPSFNAYIQIKQKQQELLETMPPNLSPYYKSKVSDYFNSFIKK